MNIKNMSKYEKIIFGTLIVSSVILLFLILFFIFDLSRLNNSNKEQIEQYISKTQNNEDEVEFEEVTSDIGKKVIESVNEQETKENETDTVNKTISKNEESNKTDNKETKNETNTKKQDDTKKENNTNNESNNEEIKEEPKFTAPINGEIIKAFASDSLVYSATLEEWTVHNGIDIKADKTSVVAASANGTVSAIKNDPRYGLTVIIDHSGGYKTVYSNLLTAEFVVEGEEVKAGQTIGTVGNSATFEIADDYHLHFEIIKDGKYIDPNTMLNI